MDSINPTRIILNIIYFALFIVAAIGIYIYLFRSISSPTPAFPSQAEVIDPTPAQISTVGGTVQFSEQFETDFGSWGTSPAGQAMIDRGGLILDDNAYTDTAWARPYLTFDHFVLQVYTRWIGGAVGGRYGVEFRIDENDNFYAFYLENGGRYTIGKELNGTWFEITSGYSEAINNNGGLNHIHIEATNNNFRFFINDTYLTDVIATTEDGLPEGDIRLVAQRAENTDHFMAAFDELILVRYPAQ